MRTLSPAAPPPPFHSPARPLFPRPCPFFPSVPPLPTRLPASTRFLPPSRDSSFLPCCSLAARHSCDRGNNRREVSARDSASSLSSSLFLFLFLSLSLVSFVRQRLRLFRERKFWRKIIGLTLEGMYRSKSWLNGKFFLYVSANVQLRKQYIHRHDLSCNFSICRGSIN